jgi:hypothetical protein
MLKAISRYRGKENRNSTRAEWRNIALAFYRADMAKKQQEDKRNIRRYGEKIPKNKERSRLDNKTN